MLPFFTRSRHNFSFFTFKLGYFVDTIVFICYKHLTARIRKREKQSLKEFQRGTKKIPELSYLVFWRWWCVVNVCQMNSGLCVNVVSMTAPPRGSWRFTQQKHISPLPSRVPPPLFVVVSWSSNQQQDEKTTTSTTTLALFAFLR